MPITSSLSSVHKLCWLALMAAGITATALFPVFIGAVPITFQDSMIVCCGIILGPKQGPKAVALYILAGAIGLPVFSGGRGGIAHIAGPTGGYLAGFIILAFFSGLSTKYFCKKQIQNVLAILALLVCGYGAVYAFGALWLAYTMKLPVGTAVAVGVLPFLPVTGVKLLLLLPLVFSLHPQLIRLYPYGASADNC